MKKTTYFLAAAAMALLLHPGMTQAAKETTVYVPTNTVYTQKDESGKVSFSRTEKLTYNKNGLLVKTEDAEGETIHNYFYDSKRRIKKMVSLFLSENPVTRRTRTFTYGSNGVSRSKEVFEEAKQKKKGIVYTVTDTVNITWKYANNGKKLTRTFKYGDGSTTKVITTSAYNKKGQITKSTYSEESDGYSYKQTCTQTFHKNGVVSKSTVNWEETRDGKTNNGDLNLKYTIKTNKKGCVTSITTGNGTVDLQVNYKAVKIPSSYAAQVNQQTNDFLNGLMGNERMYPPYLTHK